MRNLSRSMLTLAAFWLPVCAASAAAQTNFGPVDIGGSATSTVTLTVITAGTVGKIAVVTQGAAGLDFTDAGSGTCAVGTAYKANATCTLEVTFKPKLAGTRYGAAVLDDDSGHVLATEYLQGVGNGPQIAFAPGTESTIPTAQSVTPNGIVVDGSGNVYIADWHTNSVLKETLSDGAYVESTLVSELTRPTGVAVDGAGNIYIVAWSRTYLLKETLSGGSYIESTLGSGLSSPNGTVVDGSGNVFIADSSNGRTLKETLSGGTYTQSVIAVSGPSNPSSVAVDGSGKLFITDYDDSQVLELTPKASGYTQTAIGSGLLPSGIVIDGSGNLYIADTLNSRIVKETLTAGSYVQSTVANSGVDWPWGVAVDGSGNVYISDTYHFRVLKEDLGGPPSISFAATEAGSTSSDSPKTVQVQNIGNAALAFTDVSYPTDFPEETGGGTDRCTGSTSLAAGEQCDLPIEFAPESLGSLSQDVTLTDNALNVSGAKQSIAVSGTGMSPETFSASSLAFGNEAVGYSTEAQFVSLTNNLTAPLAMTSIQLTGANAASFVSSSNCGASVAAHATCTIAVRFAPKAMGAASASLTFTDSAKDSPQTLSLSGTGVSSGPATLTLSASSLAFGNEQTGGVTDVQTVTVTNTSANTLNFILGGIQLRGAQASSFYMSHNCGTSVAAGKSCTIRVRFHPLATIAYAATVDLLDNAAGSPQSISLSGTGVDTIDTTATLSPGTLDFGTESVGTASSLQMVTLTNTGTGALTIGGIAVTGVNASSFTITYTTCYEVSPCAIWIHFVPKAVGPATATLAVYDSAAGSPQTVTLTGTGK